MWPSFIIEDHIVLEHPLQIPLVQDEEVIQALGSG
jgi:hypothetical protein